jgi:hypothetical protein
MGEGLNDYDETRESRLEDAEYQIHGAGMNMSIM